MVARKRDVRVTLEERVAYLEGRGEEHAAAIAEVRLDVRDLRAEMIRRFEHIDARFDHIDSRFEHIDSRFGQIDTKCTWVIGLQFATLLAVVAALANAYFR